MTVIQVTKSSYMWRNDSVVVHDQTERKEMQGGKTYCHESLDGNESPRSKNIFHKGEEKQSRNNYVGGVPL